MAKRSIRDVQWKGRRAIVRADLNVPLDGSRITDDTRIRASLPTLRHILQRGGSVVLMSHLGRPKGQRRPELSLAPVARRLAESLGRPVPLCSEVTGPEATRAAAALGAGEIVLLENLRFDPREEANDPAFARELADLGDYFVADAFGAAHRAHASTVGIAAHIPAVAGLLLEREVEVLGRVLRSPQRPLVAILGGAKVVDKIPVIENLLGKADAILLGGGMAYTFLKAHGLEVGRSLLDEQRVELARQLLDRAGEAGTPVELPVDVVVAPRLAAGAPWRVVPAAEIPADEMGLDIGPRTAAAFCERIAAVGTVVWNGPMGVFEIEPFAAGTRQVAEAVAGAAGLTVIGGGDSAAAVQQMGLADGIDHISTGGGASLEFLAGVALPGVEVLPERED